MVNTRQIDDSITLNSPEGASYIGTADGPNVQEALDDLIVTLDGIETVVKITPKLATAGQAAISFTEIDDNLVSVEVNGIGVKLTTDYTVSGNTITFVAPLSLNDEVQPYIESGLVAPVTTSSAGLMTITDKIKVDGIIDLKSLGAQYNNNYDNIGVFNDAFAELGARGSGQINVGHYGMLYVGSTLTIPPGVHLKGEFHPGVQLVDRWDYLDVCPSGIIMPPSATITGDAFKMEHMLIWNADVNQNPATEGDFYTELAKYAGVGITIGLSGDVTLNDNMFIGWNKAGYFNQSARPEITRNMTDCINGFEVTQCYDFKSEGVSYNVGNAYLVLNKPFSILTTKRSGKMIYLHDVADGVNCWQNHSYGYQTGLHLKNVFEVKASHIADNFGLSNPGDVVGSKGIWLEGNCNGTFVDQSGAHGFEYGYYIDTGSGPPIFLGSNSVGSAVQAQIYFGAGARGHFDQFMTSAPCTDVIKAASAVGRWSGAISSWSTPSSGKLITLASAGDKNNFLKVRRDIYDPTAVNDVPEVFGVFTWAGRPGDSIPGDEAFFTDSTLTPANSGSVVSAGGGVNTVAALYYPDGQWRVQ
jgi:hypothetical protein